MKPKCKKHEEHLWVNKHRKGMISSVERRRRCMKRWEREDRDPKEYNTKLLPLENFDNDFTGGGGGGDNDISGDSGGGNDESSDKNII